MHIKIIGLGGIGSHLITPLCRHIDALAAHEKPAVVAIDGDRYEAKNADRQDFLDVGNKAEMTVLRIRRDFPDLAVSAKPDYVTDENVFFMVNSGDTVFMCVDNHVTRKIVSDHCSTLSDVILISGGNELTDGNVQVYIRKDGKDLTPPLTHFHPEIEKPTDRNPADLSCEELAKSSVPQIIFTNLTAAVLMLNAYWMVRQLMLGKGKLVYSEAFFDLLSGNTQAYLRKPVSRNQGK